MFVCFRRVRFAVLLAAYHNSQYTTLIYLVSLMYQLINLPQCGHLATEAHKWSNNLCYLLLFLFLTITPFNLTTTPDENSHHLVGTPEPASVPIGYDLNAGGAITPG